MDEKIVVATKVDPELVKAMDEIVRAEDMTRSQLIRKAIKQYISRRTVEIVKNDKREKASVQ